MSAETLQGAAVAIRFAEPLNHQIGHLDDRELRTWLAVADWLDLAGSDLWAWGPLCECGTGCDACDDNLWEPHARAALAVARAYLGADR